MKISEMIPPFTLSSDNHELRLRRHLDLQQMAAQADSLGMAISHELETQLFLLAAHYTPEESKQKVLDLLMDNLELMLLNYPPHGESKCELLSVDQIANKLESILPCSPELLNLACELRKCFDTSRLRDMPVGDPTVGPTDVAWLRVAQEVIKRDCRPVRLAREMTIGSALIAQERRRQIDQESWGYEHDDHHRNYQLMRAANAYLVSVTYSVAGEDKSAFSASDCDWPFEDQSFKPSKNPILNLVKAGALIAAEIDRLKRLKVAASDGKVDKDQIIGDVGPITVPPKPPTDGEVDLMGDKLKKIYLTECESPGRLDERWSSVARFVLTHVQRRV